MKGLFVWRDGGLGIWLNPYRRSILCFAIFASNSRRCGNVCMYVCLCVCVRERWDVDGRRGKRR